MRQLLCVLLLVLSASASPAQEHDDRFAAFTASPADIILHWKDPNGRILGNIGALQEAERAQGRTLLFAMNGGMYTQEQAPLGLFIQEGRQLAPLITRTSGHGNFYLQPNGVFGTTMDGRAFIRTTAAFQGTQKVRFATQSGPMLLVDGAINPAFRKGSANLNIRNGVGLRGDGTVVFGISRVPVDFHDFAAWFQAQGCTQALYLDGAISKAYIPGQDLRQLDGVLGVLIGVSE